MNMILQFIGKYIPESYRTKISGLCFIMLGLIGYINIVWPDLAIGSISMSFEACTVSIATGGGMIGLGRKIDRNTEAVKAATPTA